MVQGLEDVIGNIRALRDKGQRAQKDALNKMGDTFENTLRENIPVGMQHGYEIHLAEDVKKGTPRMRQGILSLKVGLAGSASTGELPAWYAHFADTGSMKKAPTFFSEKSRDQSIPELKQDVIDQFKKELGS